MIISRMFRVCVRQVSTQGRAYGRKDDLPDVLFCKTSNAEKRLENTVKTPSTLIQIGHVHTSPRLLLPRKMAWRVIFARVFICNYLPFKFPIWRFCLWFLWTFWEEKGKRKPGGKWGMDSLPHCPSIRVLSICNLVLLFWQEKKRDSLQLPGKQKLFSVLFNFF